MKRFHIIIAAFVLIFGIIGSPAASVNRISASTGVPVATLRAERASTGLGWGSLEKAHLLANASGQSFNNVVAQHRSGQGWGTIAHNNGVNLGRLVSNANRSSNATMHAKNTQTMHGKSGSHVSNGHGARAKTNTTRGGGHRSSGFSRSHGMHSMGHMSGPQSTHSMGHTGGSRGMGSMGHGGGHSR